MGTKPIPKGFYTLTANLVVKNASDAIEFYKKAFDAQEIYRDYAPHEKNIIHAELKIGDSIIMLNDELPSWNVLSPKSIGGSAVTIHMYVDDVDKIFNQAVAAGAKVTMPLMDVFWGDRYGHLEDPFGHKWSIATHKKDLSREEIRKAAEEFFANMVKQQGS